MGKNFSYTRALRACGVSYVGNTKQSAKMMYSFNAGTLTYCIYLAPWNLSGRQVCPAGKHCHENCLNGSGHNKIDILSGKNRINKARISKTQFFYKNREIFMQIVVHEIKKAQRYAKKHNLEFSVRLNGTSDLSPELFTIDGKNILQIFDGIQFYDYTKVRNRLNLTKKYGNYDLTFSFDGYNWPACEEFLKNGGRVAVVFANGLPKEYKGFKVIDANGYDMRYNDPAGVICGLHYHPTANDYKNGKFVIPDTPFVVSA